MKKLLLAVALISTITAVGQRVKSEKLEYTTERLPLQPIKGNIAGYNFKVSTPYPEDNSALEDFAKQKYQEELDNYPALVEESKILHEQAMEQYDQDVLTARENFKLESEEFKKLSLVERLAMSDQKPKLKLPSKPYYRKPAEPYYRKPNLSNSIVFKGEVLADSYLRLDGYDKSEEGDDVLTGQVVFYDFEKMDVSTEIKQESYYSRSAKKNLNRNVTYYITKYKRPTELTLTYNGETLHSGMYDLTGEYVEYNDKSRPNMFNIEKQTISDNLLEINAYINDFYGISQQVNTVEVFYVKNKKGEYDDLEEAKEIALKAYAGFDINGDNELLLDSIDIWKTALEESDLEDRKARIDTKVTEAILFNLVEAHIALKDLPTAEGYLKDLKSMKLNFSEQQKVEGYETQLASISERLEANGL